MCENVYISTSCLSNEIITHFSCLTNYLFIVLLKVQRTEYGSINIREKKGNKKNTFIYNVGNRKKERNNFIENVPFANSINPVIYL